MKATILVGDVLDRLRGMADESVSCVVTSPPYWGLRDYGIPPTQWPEIAFEIMAGLGAVTVPAMECCLGLEPSPIAFVGHCVEVFRAIRRILRPDGVLWCNMGDCYATGAGKVGECPGGGERGARWSGDIERLRDAKRGYRGDRLENGRGDQPAILRVKTRADRDGTHAGKHTAITAMGPMTQPNRMPLAGLKPKDLVGMPWRIAFALQADGWWLRQDIIWSKPNPMPESVTDRCTKAHEYLFLLTKSARYYFDQEAILEPCSPGTHARLSQDVEAQIGSERAHAGGKTNGNMKAVGRHLPGNKTHKGTTAYLEGDERQRTKAGLVDYATRMRTNYKGSIPGRQDGPGQDRRQPERKLAEVGSGTKNNGSFDAAMAIMPEKRNKRSVWEIATQPYSEAHFATFPEALVEPCILAGSKPGDTVLDPFAGSGTTGAVALRYHRDFIGIELNPEYAKLAEKRIGKEAPMFNEVIVTSPSPASTTPETPPR